MIKTLHGPLEALRTAEIDLVTDIAITLGELGEQAVESKQRLLEVAQDLREMFFMVVVIGEFNAGKSSFINAILGENLLPTGITPTTEFIELVRYNEVPNRKPNIRDEVIREWSHPNTGAPGVAIVDTPGTGSVFQKHETIAKSFLHRSDLVIFIISAKRAFAETERLYLELAKNYGKKIILVVNQIDLLQASERSEVRRFIEAQVKELLNLQPLIFMVSAKEAMSDSAAGGIDAVRAHLRGVYDETPPAQQKLIAQLDTTERIIKQYLDALRQRATLVSGDIIKVKNVQEELNKQAIGLEAQMKSASADIDQVLAGLRQRGLTFIDTHLSVRMLGRAPKLEKLQEEFQEVVVGRSLRDIGDAAHNYINAVIDHSRLYWRSVIDRLNQLRDLLEQELGGMDAGVYAEQRENLERAIKIAETELKSYSSGEIVRDMEQMFRANMGGFQRNGFLTFSGLLAIAVGILTPGPLIGAAAAPFALPAVIAGAVLTTIFGLPTLSYLRRLNRETKEAFNNKIDNLLDNYHQALDELTSKERNRLTQYSKQVLTPVFSRLEALANRYQEQQTKLNEQMQRLNNLRKRLEALSEE